METKSERQRNGLRQQIEMEKWRERETHDRDNSTATVATDGHIN